MRRRLLSPTSWAPSTLWGRAFWVFRRSEQKKSNSPRARIRALLKDRLVTVPRRSSRPTRNTTGDDPATRPAIATEEGSQDRQPGPTDRSDPAGEAAG